MDELIVMLIFSDVVVSIMLANCTQSRTGMSAEVIGALIFTPLFVTKVNLVDIHIFHKAIHGFLLNGGCAK
jgi:hypothetical protein